MPCDSVVTQEHEVGKWKMSDAIEALESQGCTITYKDENTVRFNKGWGSNGVYDRRTGQLSTTDQSMTTQDFKQAFAAQSVRSEAKKVGWTVSDVMGQKDAKRALDMARMKARF